MSSEGDGTDRAVRAERCSHQLCRVVREVGRKDNHRAEHYILEGVNMNSDNFNRQLQKLEYSKPVISNGMEYDGFYTLNNKSTEQYIRNNLRGNYLDNEPQLLNKLDVDEVELVLLVPSTKSSGAGLTNELSIELPEGLSIRLSKELSKGLSETAATIYKLIYADNYITRGDIAKKVGVSVTAVQKHVNKLKSIRLLDREGSASHGHWIIIEN